MNSLTALIFFLSLMIAHLIGDWLIQTEYQALNKAKGGRMFGFLNQALITHCMMYTLCFVPVFLVFHVQHPLLALSVIFGSHMFFDKRWFVIGWCRYLKRTSQETINQLFWLVIVVDQVFHFLVLCGIFFAAMYTSIKENLTFSLIALQ